MFYPTLNSNCHPERSECFRKKAFAQSKDPLKLCAQIAASGNSLDALVTATLRRENALTRLRRCHRRRGPSAPFDLRLAKIKFPLRMTGYWWFKKLLMQW